MPDSLVTCPQCGHKFPLAEVMRHGIEEDVRKELEKKFSTRQRALTKEMEVRSAELQKREAHVAELQESVAREVEEKVKAQGEKLKDRAREEAREELSLELKGKEEELKQARTRLKEFRAREEELLALKAQLDDREREIPLEIQRALAQKRKDFEETVRAEETEKWGIQLRTKDEELARVKAALEEAQRVGVSGEMLGEIAELTLEERLRKAFPDDTLEPVGRGKRGGDILQNVQGGGSILWESKDGYASWSNDWVPKLKRDRDVSKASVGILVTKIGPGSDSVRTASYYEDVILTPPEIVVGVASLLRPQFAELARQRRLYERQGSIQAAVYAWVTSQDFQRGVAAVVENLQHLQARVASAKASQVRWFRRMSEDVDLTMAAIGEFYGSAQSHARLPNLRVLALNSGEPDEDGDAKSEGEPEGPREPGNPDEP
jgi:hypothetical protein